MEIELGANEVKSVNDAAHAETVAHTATESATNIAPVSPATPEQHPETALAQPALATADDQTQNMQATQLAIAAARVIRSASWFYWIAGLSAINVVSGAFGATIKFIIGLGISEVFTALATDAGTDGGSTLSIALLYAAGLGVTAFFGFCGWFARRPSSVAFVVGMVAFALDTLIFVYVSDWIGVAFHAYVLFNLWRGFVATAEFKKLQAGFLMK
jgi:hypothetical protein